MKGSIRKSRQVNARRLKINIQDGKEHRLLFWTGDGFNNAIG